MLKLYKNHLIFFLVAAFVIFWGMLVIQMGPEGVVDMIGVQNSYLLMFGVALFGGISTFTAPSFFATLVTLASGGLNPLLLGIFTGAGMWISDSVFFLLGVHARPLLSGRLGEMAKRFSIWIGEKPAWAVPFIVFFYTGLTPLPNDILMLALALASVSFKRIALVLFLGSFTLATIVASLSAAGYSLFWEL